MTFFINVAVSALAISVASWLAGRSPGIAGFLVAMPLASMLVLPLSYHEHRSAEASIALAQSIFVAIPVSLLFFFPFLVSERLQLGFWKAYVLGCAALPLGYVAHRAAVKALIG